MDDLKGRQELYNGFSNSFSLSIELVVTPLVFGAIGLVLDHLFGLLPLLTVVLTLLALVGKCVKMYYTYADDMQAHEAAAPWARGPRKAGK